MAKVTYPAREYRSGVPLMSMDRGGYQRRVNDTTGVVTWHFKLPVEVPVYNIIDSQVPTINGMPVVTIGNWHLDRMMWIRLEAKS